MKDKKERISLEQRCNEAVGAIGSNVLLTVLSYFPETAKRFIRTQEHAAVIEGRRQVWYSIRHQEDGYGLDGLEYYYAGHMEHLDVHGFTGKGLIKIITEVEVIRGLKERGHDDASVGEIIRVAQRMPHLRVIGMSPEDTPLSDYEQMVAKTLEVMHVTRQEIRLLRAHKAINEQVDTYLSEIERLKQRAAALESALDSAFPATDLEDALHHEQWQKFHEAVDEQDIAIHPDDYRPKFILDTAFGSEICVLDNPDRIFELVFLAFEHSRGTDGPCGFLLNLYAFRQQLARGVAPRQWYGHLHDVEGLPADTYITLRDWLAEQGYDVNKLLAL